MKTASQPRKRETVLRALRQQNERAELDLIRRRLALPVEKRLNFLRVRLPGDGSRL
ncbi:MAG: hypothetical protein KJ072_05785 [Verrucomicrobia bacterium]|nr:hypothetical protein [Verrucomicrobiota bacterium]